jgi:hypothetical protein
VALIKATTASADAPNIPDDIYPGEFTGLTVEHFPEWVTDKSAKYGKPDDGNRLRFDFGLLDEKGKPYFLDPEDDAPVSLNALTSTSMNVKSQTVPKAVRFLKAIMTKAEFAAFEGGEDIEETALYGRKVQLEVEKNEKGWPTIVNVIAAPGKK